MGGGADLDGDGRVEFVVGRFLENAFAPSESSWLVAVYQMNGDDEYSQEWEVAIVGGKCGGNGVALGDVNGDGKPELAIAVAPHLYLFEATGVDDYEPVWHQPIADSFRPTAGDPDGDGRTLLVMNVGDRAIAFGMVGSAGALQPPSGLSAIALDETSARLAWLPVPGADAYQVYRNAVPFEDLVEDLFFVDTGLDVGLQYAYSVTAVDTTNGVESATVGVVVVQPRLRPRITEVAQLSRHQVGITFDSPMDVDPEHTYLFIVRPEAGAPPVGAPSSIFADRDSRRVVVSFATALPDSGRYRLEVGALTAVGGTPIDPGSRVSEFELRPVVDPVRLVEVSVQSSTRLVLKFSGSVEFAAPDAPDSSSLADEDLIGLMFRIDEAAVRIREVVLDADGSALLILNDETPLLARGH